MIQAQVYFSRYKTELFQNFEIVSKRKMWWNQNAKEGSYKKNQKLDFTYLQFVVVLGIATM